MFHSQEKETLYFPSKTVFSRTYISQVIFHPNLQSVQWINLYFIPWETGYSESC